MNQNRFRTTFDRVAYFDLEANGLATPHRAGANKPLQPPLDRVWCGVIIDQDGVVHRYEPDEVPLMVTHLMGYDCIIGHNIIEYDWRVLKRLYPSITVGDEPVQIDTLVTARMLWPDRELCSYVSRHGLKQWGEFLADSGRVEAGKTEYAGGFDQYCPEMLDYCVQDVRVTKALWEFLRDELVGYEDPLEREHRRAERLAAMSERGVGFDMDGAGRLLDELTSKHLGLREQLQSSFPSRVQFLKTPAYYRAGGLRFPTIGAAKAAGYSRSEIIAGPLRTKTHPFEPDSRQQIYQRLRDRYDWKPKRFTEKGNPIVDEAVLRDLPYPEAAMICDYLMLGKRLSQLTDWIDRAAWSGRIHSTTRGSGTVSGRCSSSQPNLQQVTSARQQYGREMRALFRAGEGSLMVGCDAAQLELRILAHYLADYDEGEYVRVVTESDAHQANADAFGVSRDDAKTAIFALVYGCGDAKFGSIVGGGAEQGKRMRTSYFERFPQVRHLMERCMTDARTRGHLRLLDGRDVPVRAEHSALNLLIQGSGQCVMTLAWDLVQERMPPGAGFVLEVHDEAEIEAPIESAEEVARLMEWSIAEAGRLLGVRCPMAGEARIGANWLEVH